MASLYWVESSSDGFEDDEHEWYIDSSSSESEESNMDGDTDGTLESNHSAGIHSLFFISYTSGDDSRTIFSRLKYVRSRNFGGLNFHEK